MTLTILVPFALSALLLNLTPGPSILYVMSRSITSGRGVGVCAAFGLATGSALWAVLTAIGVSAVITSSHSAFLALRVIGALYLLYLGVMGLRQGHFVAAAEQPGSATSPRRSYAHGLVVEATNPKTVTFFLALVPQLTATLSSPPLIELIAFCLIVPLTALPIDATIGMTGGLVAAKIAERPLVSRVLNYASSAVLIGLAAFILVE